MKTIKLAAILISILNLTALLGGCSSPQGPVQKKEYSITDIKSIMLDYDGESVTVKESDSDKIMVVEYMDKSRKSYFADINRSGGILTISEGARPIGNGVHSSLELYIPDTYQNSLSLHTTDGQILYDAAMSLNRFQADTTSGTILISNLKADKIGLKSTGGNITAKNIYGQICSVETTNANTFMETITGDIEYVSKGGNLTLTQSIGCGTFQVTGDGSLNITFDEVTGDISAHTKNGNITLGLPDGLNFAFKAYSQNGNIQTSFLELLTASDKTVSGTIGARYSVKIILESKNGTINVTK